MKFIDIIDPSTKTLHGVIDSFLSLKPESFAERIKLVKLNKSIREQVELFDRFYNEIISEECNLNDYKDEEGSEFKTYTKIVDGAPSNEFDVKDLSVFVKKIGELFSTDIELPDIKITADDSFNEGLSKYSNSELSLVLNFIG